MARIRSLKPEAFQSETLAEVSLAAERTFLGLSTQADDRGRLPDKPAVLNGLLWAERGERAPHTAVDLDQELNELAVVHAVCRYTGCDGKRYLHLITWDRHQKIDKRSQSRIPPCPEHQVGEGCHHHDGPCARSAKPAMEATADPAPSSGPSGEHTEQAERPAEPSGESAESSEGAVEPSALDLGPRTVDLGSVPPSAGRDPAPRGAPDATAQTLIAEYVRTCARRPPKVVLGKLGRTLAALLAEGFTADELRPAMAEWARRGLDPAVLPSVVNELSNATGPPGRRRSTTDDRVAQALHAGQAVAAELAAHANGGPRS